MKRKSTLVDSVSAEPEVSAVGRKRLSLTVIPQNKANRLRNVSCEPVYAAPLARRSQSPARRSQSPTRRRATFNFKLLTAFAVLLCLFFGGKAWGQTTLWSENFEGGSMPSGWTTDGSGSWSVATAVNSTHPSSAGEGTYCAQIKHGTTGNATKLITPTINLSAVTSAELSLMRVNQSWAGDIDELKIYYRTSTSGTWTLIESYTDAQSSWNTESGIVLPNLTSTYQLAFEYIDNYGYGLGIDYVQIVQGASCPKPTALSATTNVQNATITWIGSAGSYDIARSTNASASPDDCVVATGVSSNSYDFSSLSLADHYVWVRADCGGNGKSNWTAPVSFHIGYCNPAPTSIDNSGVTNVTFGTGSNVVNNSTHPTSSPYYGDYTAQIGAVEAGVQASMSITYATGYTYNTYVWVDLNNNLTFEASEVVCYGESTSNNPTTLELNFTIPANQTPGDYRMRIGGADSGLGSNPNNANPCYSSTYGIFEDYTLRVLAPPSCLQPTGLSLSASGNSVTATWIGTASAYNIDINGVVTNNVTSPYTFTGSLATTYAIRVQADCATDGTSEWTSPQSVTTDLCLIANQCEISYSLTDQYNDSWNGASIDVVDSETSEIIATITMPNVSGPYTGSFNVCNGRTLNFVWNSGSYDSECSYTIKDANGDDIFSGSGILSTVNYTVNCGSCPKPTGLTASNITGSSADISWTGSAESYNVRWSTLPIHNYTFDDGTMQGWTNLKVNADGGHWLNSDDNPGGYDYSVNAHSGSNFAMSYSFIDYDGAYNTNVYFISPQRYSIGANASLNFWYKFANSSYPDHMEVCVAIVDNPTASDFTSIWNSTTIDDWTEVNISLSTYAGQSIWIAFHHEDEDMYEVWVDDIAIELGYDWNYTTSNDNNITINGLSPNTTYVAQVQSDCGGDGTSNWSSTTFTTPFQIATVEQWNQFCGYVNNCTRDFYGETVFLAANIGPVSTMAGTESCPFRGTFEGQGYKINVGISSSEQGAAPFRYISGATIQNLKVDGTITTTAHHASGLVGFCADDSNNTIQNCLVSTNVTNDNAYAGDGGNNYMGGIIGHNKNATTSIIGCVYDGTLTSQGFKGGMFGFIDDENEYPVSISITNSYFAGSYSANGYSKPNFSPVAVRSAHGFTLNLATSNFYYNTDAGTFEAPSYSYEGSINVSTTGTPKHGYTVTGETDVVDVAMNGSPTTYNVSGIAAYGTGIVYDGTIYGGDGDNLSLSLGYTCALSGYLADNGTLSGSATTGTNDAYTLTMAASNTTINASVAITVTANPSDGGTVSAGGTYQAGSSCTVTATANTGYTFSNWEKSGSEVSTSSSYTFNVSCAGELVANFTPNTYQVTLHTDGGTINAGNVTSYTYGVGATLPSNVTKTGYTFAGWYDNSGLSGSAVTSISTTDYGDKEYWAKWIVNSYTVTTIVYPSAGGTATGEGSYNYGTTATISATANTGYQFVNWTGSDGSVVSHNASYSFTVTGDVTYQANFTSTTPLSLPWSANFDNYSGPTPQLLPGEWATPLRNEQKPCVHNYAYGAASDPWCLEMRGSDASMVVLPQFDRPLNKLTVSFKCARGTTTGPAKLGYVTDPSDAGSFVELATMSTPVYLSGSNPQPTSYSFDLTTIANAPDNSNYRLAIRATNIAESFYFDDFWVIEFSAESASVDNSYCIDEVASTLSVNVSGSGSYSYQWYKDGSSISGETGSSYTPLTETDGTATYTVSVTDRNCGNTANVTIAQITVNTPSPDVSGTYDYIWRGLSADWNTASNWYMYSEGNYTVASIMPTEAKDYYIGTGSSCIEPSYWPSFIDDVEVNNITIASGSNDITIGEGKTLTIDGAATFSGGIIKGNVEFGASGSTTGASLTSYVDGIVTKNGNGSSFTFPTGSDGVLGTITATITSGESAVAKFNHKSSGFDQEHDGYPRWWNVADMCGAEPFNHVSNFEYWDFNSTADLSGVTFVSKASSADAHFHNPSEYPADDSDIIQIAVYDGCWKNIGGHLEMSDENKTITISGVNASRGTTRSGSAITTFGSKDPSVVLPIELTSFAATCDGRSALVEWSTATEKNNDYFSLERSDDAINFTEVARVAGAGNSIEPIDYAYNDYGIHGGDNYYRLVQVDYDGTRTVSEVIVANCIEPESDGEPEVLAYPNPFSSELTVVLDNFGNRAATIEVYDMLGKLIYTNKVASPQNSYETILNLSNLPPAAYTVRVSTNDFVINRNVVKQ